MAPSRSTPPILMLPISIIFGFVEAASDVDEKIVVAHGLLVGQTGAESPDAEGWDYGEYAITNDDPWIPHTHGGVSGSAVWRIDLPMDGLRRKAISRGRRLCRRTRRRQKAHRPRETECANLPWRTMIRLWVQTPKRRVYRCSRHDCPASTLRPSAWNPSSSSLSRSSLASK